MRTNNYNEIKSWIILKLKQQPMPLEPDKISNEISKLQLLIDELGLEKVETLILNNADRGIPLMPEEWAQIKRELEADFDVKMDHGFLVQGDEQRTRDNSWWSSQSKLSQNNYYWKRYEKYLRTTDNGISPAVLHTLDNDTDVIMNNIGKPQLNNFSRYGMVVGHVQSGKTGSYSALICKAADAGYKFIVVIAGNTNILRNQTQDRLNESFVGKDCGIPIGAGISDSSRELLPISLTASKRDFNSRDAKSNSSTIFENTKTPVLLVVKKNTSVLGSVISWLKHEYKNKISDYSMLIIDDESDYASINTNDDEENPTKINKSIRELLSLFTKSSYVAYTATPYANIFIDHDARNESIGDDLFPKDFIYTLDAPTNYFGARRIFYETNDKHLIKIDDYVGNIPANHTKEYTLASLPASLKEAVRLFIINLSIRYIRGHKDHNSMLIHVSRFTLMHKQVAQHIKEYLDEIQNNVEAYSKLNNASEISEVIKDIENTYELRVENSEQENWQDILINLGNIINSITIHDIHKDTEIPLEYPKTGPWRSAIVIGGASLARGYTVAGLSVSYFLRTTIFYDTLMQMGRWFGYRPGYEGLCRIYMPNSTIEYFRHICSATDELVSCLKEMSLAKRTPLDYGLAVKQHPDSLLQVTARNKQKNTSEHTYQMNLNGALKETVRFHNDNTKNTNIEKNKVALRQLLSKLNFQEPKKKAHFLWRDIDATYVSDFLNEFVTYQTDNIGAKNLMPINHIKEYVNTINTKWDIALYSGDGEIEYQVEGITVKPEVRNVPETQGEYIELKQRKLSTGNAEKISLDAESLAEYQQKINNNGFKKGEATIFIRKNMPNPLLMLHVLQIYGFEDTLPAFGICFPFGLSNNQTVSYTCNSVFGIDDASIFENSYNDE